MSDVELFTEAMTTATGNIPLKRGLSCTHRGCPQTAVLCIMDVTHVSLQSTHVR